MTQTSLRETDTRDCIMLQRSCRSVHLAGEQAQNSLHLVECAGWTIMQDILPERAFLEFSNQTCSLRINRKCGIAVQDLFTYYRCACPVQALLSGRYKGSLARGAARRLRTSRRERLYRTRGMTLHHQSFQDVSSHSAYSIMREVYACACKSP